MMADPTPPAFDSLLLRSEGGIGRLTLNRPHKLNALSPATMQEIITACQWLAARDDLRIVLLDGAGRAFCGGFDLDAMREGRGRTDRDATDLGRRMIEALEAIPAITLSLVQGHCVGGGVLLALTCDLCLAADDARFSIPEIKWGLIPDVGTTQTLRDVVPLDVAKELTFTGRVVAADEALALGLVTEVVADPVAAAHELAGQIASHSPDAIRRAKLLLEQAWNAPAEQALQLEERLQRELLGSPNQIAAVEAGMGGGTAEFADPV